MKALGYIRVSLNEEHPENQEIALKEFCERNGIELLKVFRDVGVSGAEPALQRPNFKKLLQAAELMDIKTIVVFDLTRIGRDIFDVINTLKYLYDKGFNILFVKHPELNLNNTDSYVARTMRRALVALLASFAEMERSFIRERTKQGMERARREGKHIGRPPIPFPVDKVRQLLAQGKTIKDTWRYLKETGEICRQVRETKQIECMAYETFRRKVKVLKLKSK